MTNTTELFEAREYEGTASSGEAVALVAGFAGKIADLEQAAVDLAGTGRDVVVYTHHPEVITGGDPQLLPQLIENINDDFASRTAGSTQRRYGGISLGGAIAASMQKADPNPEAGLYAATGIDLPTVLGNPLFRLMVRKEHGVNLRNAYSDYSRNDLHTIWQEIHVAPSTPFTIVLGGMDYIIRKRAVVSTINNEWRRRNADIRVLLLPTRGHNGTLRWFDANALTMLDEAPAIQPATTVTTKPAATYATD